MKMYTGVILVHSREGRGIATKALKAAGVPCTPFSEWSGDKPAYRYERKGVDGTSEGRIHVYMTEAQVEAFDACLDAIGHTGQIDCYME